jgi:hypothetical protein
MGEASNVYRILMVKPFKIEKESKGNVNMDLREITVTIGGG